MNSENVDPRRKQIKYILVLFIIGTVYAGLAKLIFKIDSDAAQVTFILFPMIAFFIFEGKLREIIMPGGFSAKFYNVSQQNIELSSEQIDLTQEQLQTIEKGNARDIWEKMDKIDENIPAVLSLKMGQHGYYARHVLKKYIQELSQLRTFKYVVINDQYGKFACYIPATALLQKLSNQEIGDEFVKIINYGELYELFEIKGIIKSKILYTAKNVEALDIMNKKNLNALIVVNEEDKILGLVERENIIIKLILAFKK